MPLQLEGRSLLTVNGSNAKLQGLKVLVIDDSKTIRRTAETLLAKEGPAPGGYRLHGEAGFARSAGRQGAGDSVRVSVRASLYAPRP